MGNIINHASEILLLIFLVITFLESGIDKIIDWKKNHNWLKIHFQNTFFKNVMPLLLGIILVLEVLTGILCFMGVIQILTSGEIEIATYGAVLSCIALLMLLLGQRIAKDYQGAMTIVIYFIPAIFLVILLRL